MLCNRIPWPLNEGGNLATWNLATSLQNQGHIVDLLCLNTTKHFIDPEKVPSEINALYSVPINTNLSIVGFIQNLFSSKPYIVERFISEEFKTKLGNLLRENTYDIIQFEGLYMCPYAEFIKISTNVPMVLRAHNVEYKIWERLAQNQSNFLKKIYLAQMSQNLRHFEYNKMQEMDGILYFTQEDLRLAQAMGYSGKAKVIPAGIHTNNKTYTSKAKIPFSIGFIGSMDWIPNQDAIFWFTSEIFPGIKKIFPEASFRIAGRKISSLSSHKSLHVEGIVIEGEVESSTEFINQLELFVVPLRAGGGMRLKILEAMSAESCILSTSTGAEGIEGTAGIHFEIADTKENFRDKAISLLNDPERRKHLGMAAKELANSNYSWYQITLRTIAFYSELI